MRTKNKLIIFFTILAGLVMVVITTLAHPTVKEENVNSTTVTLGSYRYVDVGFVPTGRHGSTTIYAMVFQASDGHQYQVAMFYKDEAEALAGRTVSIRYEEKSEDWQSWQGARMIVELSEEDTVHYTLEEVNQRQKDRLKFVPVIWGLLAFFPIVLVILDETDIVSFAIRHRRHRRRKEAHEKQLDNLQNRPRNFPNSQWQTEDGTLTLTVDGQGRTTGIIRLTDEHGGKTIPVIFEDNAHTIARMAVSVKGKKRGSYIEIWEADNHSPDEFFAKPKKTTYFKKGKRVTLQKLSP